ncbi:SRC kinase signaling inhibitor 1 isoform X1 [Rhinatrema bivittatum]|uniref:SRC kinase signaling inhibitor 1 isoform X1 n=1 Tax=Rhinatrema bivittatum TaxID=194408 RepID=UPI001128992C|nr:SRC kinase signaling inhibitor 1 isoform X1 [Rhinatrema bivittatum]
MSEAELPIGFNRMNRFRQSLPLSRSSSQTKLRSPGILFLQFGDETRRVHITHEISSMDTLHALIVHMFPQKLTMGMLKSPNTAILIKDESRNVFYELEDVRDIQDRSIIKIYRKEPLYASFPASHIANGDLRREMVYSSRDSSPTRRLNNMSPAAHLTSGSPPPVLQSSSPSRSRMSYSGGRPPSYAGSPVHHGERLSNLPPAQGVSPSPSAILERRDVKPDEDLTNKNMVLVKNEGLYADPYGMVHEGRLSISSTQSLAGMGDPFSYSGGLYKRGSVRSLSTYSAAALQTELEESLYKPNAQIYGDTYGPSMGFRMPPSSPQKMPVDVQQGQSPHSPYSGSPSRSSPVRQSFRKDSCSSVFMESPVKSRNSSTSGPPELFQGTGERPLSGFSPPMPAKEVETRERMEAMEKQIASLTGLVQSALLRGSDSENPSEKTEPVNEGAAITALVGPSSRSSMATPVSTPTPAPASQPTAITRLHMQLHLHDLQQNASDLRNQLQQLKKLQLQNQETVKTMLKRTETEISVRVTDTMRKQEDPIQRQRALVEEERLKYLNEEELITQQLNDLEKSVEKIKRDLTHNHRLIAVQELEEKALVLKQLGETLTELKAHFPSLQSKMRVVLRVEVEAVKFLKEEPNRLDSLLKRCKTVTDTLAQIRRQVEERVWNLSDNLSQSQKQVMAESDISKNSHFDFPTGPLMQLHELTSATPQSWESLSQSVSEFSQNIPNLPINPQHGNNPSGVREMTVKASVGPETLNKKSADKSVSVEAAERDWEEKRAALTQYSAKDINRLLEETQAELMKAIPDLEFAAKHKQPGSSTSIPEQKPTKPQHAQKVTAKTDPNGRRGSDELTVPKYRTEKPSKSPPPPPPRRSFPSSHGLTTTRTGEVIVISKKEATFIKKADSEELESQKPQVKLRRTMSEVTRPASTPPIVASGIKDDDDEDRIIAELEVFERSSCSPFIPKFHCDQLTAAVSLSTTDMWPNEATAATGWKEREVLVSPARGVFILPHILLTGVSNPPSLTEVDFELTGKASSPEYSEASTEVFYKEEMEKEGPTWPFVANQPEKSSVKFEGKPVGVVLWSEETSCSEIDRAFLVQEDMHDTFQSMSIEVPVERHSNSIQSELSPLYSDEASVPDNNNVPTADNIAFIITPTKIQALSENEVHELRKEKGEEVYTLNVEFTDGLLRNIVPEESIFNLDKKAILVIFEETLKLEMAYKRLSAIIEDDEGYGSFFEFQSKSGIAELETQMASQSLEEKPHTCEELDGKDFKQTEIEEPEELLSQAFPVPMSRSFPNKDPQNEASEQLKVRLPKVHCHALSQAIKSGATSVSRIIEVVSSEQKEKSDSYMEKNQIEGRRCALNLTENIGSSVGEPSLPCIVTAARSQEICRSTYKRLDSFEESIRELELTISELGGSQRMGQLENPSAGGMAREETGDQKMLSDTEKEGTPLNSSQRKATNLRTRSSVKKPPLLPKPQLPVSSPKSGGVSIPAMKMVNPAASRLKVTHQGSPEKSKHMKQRLEYMRIQGQQQCSLWLSNSLRQQSKVTKTSFPSSNTSLLPASHSRIACYTFSGSDSSSLLFPSSIMVCLRY